MGIALYRIDDRLIHGQVVVGWGKPLHIGFIVLVDDAVATCDWEQDLYRMGVPPHVEVHFVTTDAIGDEHAKYAADSRTGILLAGDAASMLRVVEQVPSIHAVNVGGIHYRADRIQKSRYVFLTADEERTLRDIEARGVTVTAQDVPSARHVPLTELLRGDG